MSLKFDVIIYCPKCKTVKVKDNPQETDADKSEACWACGESFKVDEWKPITVGGTW